VKEMIQEFGIVDKYHILNMYFYFRTLFRLGLDIMGLGWVEADRSRHPLNIHRDTLQFTKGNQALLPPLLRLSLIWFRETDFLRGAHNQGIETAIRVQMDNGGVLSNRDCRAGEANPSRHILQVDRAAGFITPDRI